MFSQPRYRVGAVGRRRPRMWLLGVGTLAAVVAGCTSPPPLGKQLSANEIRSTIAGNTVRYTNYHGYSFVTYFAPDGTVTRKSSSGITDGKWRVTGDGRWCISGPNGDRCWTVVRDGDGIAGIDPDGSVYFAGKVEHGDQVSGSQTQS